MPPRKGTKRKANAAADAAQDAQKLPLRAKSEDSHASGAPSQPKGTLKVFGDDDDDDVVVPTAPAPKAKQAPAESEEDSDDDEAPEAVSTQQAASSVKQSAQAVQKAALEQAAAQKRKRQERDALFKQQAKGRKEAEKATVKDDDEEEEEEEDDDDDNVVVSRKAKETTSGRRRADRRPNLLTEDLLADLPDEPSENEDEDEVMQTQAFSGPKRRKVSTVERNLTRLDRGPKDERVGSTVYKVAKKSDDRLPPKSRKNAQGVKRVLMRRDRVGVKPRAGFFKK